MNSKTGWVVGIIVIIIIIIGAVMYMHRSSGNGSSLYGTSDTNTTAGPASTSTVAVPGDNLTLGENTSSDLGTYLVAYNGMTLYTYAPDTAGVSNCTGGCAVNWPPYVVTSTNNLVAESPIAGVVSTLTRADGSTQVTYNGHPLYFYVKDTKPGDTVGQGVGGVWYVVKP